MEQQTLCAESGEDMKQDYRDLRQEQQQYYQQRQRLVQQYRYQATMTPEEWEARRNGREEARRLRQQARRKKKLRRILRYTLPLLLAAAILIAGTGTVLLVRSLWKNLVPSQPESHAQEDMPPAGDISVMPEEEPEKEPEEEPEDIFRTTPATVNLPDRVLNPDGTPSPEEKLNSAYAILIDLDEGTVLVQRNGWTVIHPASMTKIMTILVAAEHILNYDATAVITQETIDYCIENDCSIAGFQVGEEVSIMDLFYGTILPSGADAAVTLAEYTAGSHEAFVEMMNEKAEDLGIAGTAHFANCVGLYDEKNVCTVYDMAVILRSAMENPLCSQVLGLKTRILPANELHPEGISLSNWFIRRIEDHMPAGVVIQGAKTGFISQAGSCAASVARDGSGRRCLCVTAMAGSAWQCIFDHAALYAEYGFNPLD